MHLNRLINFNQVLAGVIIDLKLNFALLLTTIYAIDFSFSFDSLFNKNLSILNWNFN